MPLKHLLDPASAALHTYMGAFFHSPSHGAYIPDPWRAQSTVVLGSPTSGAREWLSALAFSDAAKSRPVIFVDAWPTREALDSLWYWNHVVAGRPFLAFLPTDGFSGLSHSWNPLSTSTQSIQSIGETIFAGYRTPPPPAPVVKGKPPAPPAKDAPGALERNIFLALLRAMQSAELSFCLRDVRAAIEDPKALDALGTLVRRSGKRHYDTVTKEAESQGEDWLDAMSGLVDYLKQFDVYTLNSYNPQIDLEWLIYTDATVYFGLPQVGPQAKSSGVLGQLLLQQVMALASWIQTNARLYRRSVSLILHGAGAFARPQTAETLQRMRASGLLTTLAFEDKAAMDRVGPEFSEQLLASKPNALAFPGLDAASADWFCRLAGSEREPAGGARALEKLGPGQCYYLPCEEKERAVRLVPAALAGAPDLPMRRYHRLHYPNPPQRRGLNLNSQRTPEAEKEAARAAGTPAGFDPEQFFYQDFEKELAGGD